MVNHPAMVVISSDGQHLLVLKSPGTTTPKSMDTATARQPIPPPSHKITGASERNLHQATFTPLLGRHLRLPHRQHVEIVGHDQRSGVGEINHAAEPWAAQLRTGRRCAAARSKYVVESGEFPPAED
jgi:hypothetical protein